MSIEIDHKLPDSTLYKIGGNGPETIKLSSLYTNRKLAIFAMPGAFTPTCSRAHLPSIIETADKMLGDPLSEFTKAVGMEFDAPGVGFLARSKRYAMVAEDGFVKIFLPETARSTCDISGGKALLDLL